MMVLARWKKAGNWTVLHRVRVELREKIWGASTACNLTVPKKKEVTHYEAGFIPEQFKLRQGIRFCARCFDWRKP